MANKCWTARAFLNPAEERGGGGFLGSYAELRSRNGKITMTRSGSIHELAFAARPGTRTLTGPPDYLERYGRFRPADYLQDIPFSPHFPYTAEVISQLYPQSGGTHLDGVLAIDPYALAAMLSFTGPIRVDGIDPVVFNLAGTADLAHGAYRLRVLPQPTVIPDSLTVDIRPRATLMRRAGSWCSDLGAP